MMKGPDDHPFEDALAQIEVMKQVAELLRTLSPANAAKVIAWAGEQLGSVRVPSAPVDEVPAANGGRDAPREYDQFGDLFAESRAKSGPDRVLVAAYWLQVCQQGPDFEAAEVTRLLKDAGHAVANTGATLRLLSTRRPVLVIQTQKKGTAKQSRKRYRLTTEGQRHVDGLVAGAQTG